MPGRASLANSGKNNVPGLKLILKRGRRGAEGIVSEGGDKGIT